MAEGIHSSFRPSGRMNSSLRCLLLAGGKPLWGATSGEILSPVILTVPTAGFTSRPSFHRVDRHSCKHVGHRHCLPVDRSF
jgi:hypothetical protein